MFLHAIKLITARDGAQSRGVSNTTMGDGMIEDRPEGNYHQTMAGHAPGGRNRYECSTREATGSGWQGRVGSCPPGQAAPRNHEQWRGPLQGRGVSQVTLKQGTGGDNFCWGSKTTAVAALAERRLYDARGIMIVMSAFEQAWNGGGRVRKLTPSS